MVIIVDTAAMEDMEATESQMDTEIRTEIPMASETEKAETTEAIGIKIGIKVVLTMETIVIKIEKGRITDLEIVVVEDKEINNIQTGEAATAAATETDNDLTSMVIDDRCAAAGDSTVREMATEAAEACTHTETTDMEAEIELLEVDLNSRSSRCLRLLHRHRVRQ